MEHNLVAQVRQFRKSHKEMKRGHRVLTVLAGIVIFVTVYALMLPAVTMSNEVICGKEAHVHDASCYGLKLTSPQPQIICGEEKLGGIVIHSHNQYCYDEEHQLICALAEREVHVHTGACYQEHRKLVCQETQEKGHVHDKACYSYERGELTCQESEDRNGHTHTEDCYRLETREDYICGQTEDGGHTHTDSCYTEKTSRTLTCTEETGGESEGHTHTEECYTASQRLACGQSESEGHSHSDSCYTIQTKRVRGELTCTEGEHGDEIDEGGSLVRAAHSHSDSCYAWEEETEEVLSCGQRESAGHSHSDSCYQTESKLTCGQTEGGGGGHVHGDGCYTETTERALTCGRTESEGHVHTGDCKRVETERTLVCAQEEGGHTHGDGCYDWIKTLTCRQEERETGHVHTDGECYEIMEVLACHKEELIPHTHSEDCWEEFDENGDGEIEEDERRLACGLEEVRTHDHSAGCVYIPEEEPQEAEGLICGLEEHVHEDTCYLETVPPEERYYCGKSEHLHGVDCYFDSGMLFCTIPEHIHESACLVPPSPETAERQELVELNDTYETETEEFHLRIHVEGTALVMPEENLDPWDSPELRNGWTSEGAAPLYREPEADTILSLPDDGTPLAEEADLPEEDGAEPVQPEPEPVRPEPEPVQPEPEPVGPEPDPVQPEPDLPEPEYVPEPEPGLPERNPVQPEPEPRPVWPDAGGSAEPETVYLDPQDVRVHVEESEITEMPAGISEESGGEEEEPLLTRVLTFSASINGRELDLSQCSVRVEVSLSAAMQEYLDSYSEAQPMTIDGGAEAGEGSAEAEFLLMAYQPSQTPSAVEQLGSMVVGSGADNGGTMTFSLDEPAEDTGTRDVALVLLPNVYPDYTVEYYANLQRPATSGDVPLTLIDTSGGVLPENGRTPKTTALYLDTTDDANRVKFETKLEPIYTQQNLRFNPRQEEKLNTKYLNSIGGNTLSSGLDDSEEVSENSHFNLKEIWVRQAQKGADGKVLTDGEGNPLMEDSWTVYASGESSVFTDRMPGSAAPQTYTGLDLNSLAYTNNVKAAAENSGSQILIAEGTVIRMIYDPSEGTYQNNKTVFYDYDVTSGSNQTKPIYYANAVKQGINSGTNYDGDGAKYAFGNGNIRMGWEDENYGGGVYLNKANTNKVFGGCAFGLVSDYLDGSGNVQFASGITGPDIFGGESAAGKHPYTQYPLKFNRQGDTYTLTEVVGTNATELDRFSEKKLKWNTTDQYILSNAFWPMDVVRNADPHFGTQSGEMVNRVDGQDIAPFPASDNGKAHNSYFGMNFAVKFNLAKEYVGPLEYYFFGDDDMWVFLDGKLVCDIGGVHAAVGEYVDLWDYIPKEGREADVVHTLSFFYTERGASGSTCWMQFTLPNAATMPVNVSPDEENRPLIIRKVVDGNQTDGKEDILYPFSISLEGTNNRYQAMYYRLDENQEKVPVTRPEDPGFENPFWVESTQENTFSLRGGEWIEVLELPSHVLCTVKELYEDPECHTSVQKNNEAVQKDTKEITVGGVDEITTITFTNTFNYELPATGGSGTLWYTLTGFLPIVGCGLWYRKKSQGEGVDG